MEELLTVKAKLKHQRHRIVILIMVLSIFLSACTETEKPMPEIPAPVLQSVEINTNYLASHYYSLSQKKVITSHQISEWDLRLCSQNDKYYIHLNTAKNMRIARYNGKFSDTMHPLNSVKWQMDMIADGKVITGMGNWGDFSFTNPKSYGYTYLVDLGYYTAGNELGYRKIEIIGCTNNQYIIKFGLLNDPLGDTLKIDKKSGFNNVFVLLESKAKVLEVEPPSAKWDLLFTQYGLSSQVKVDGKISDTVFSFTDMILLNNAGRQIYCDSIKSFDKITFWDAEKYTYSSAIDFIGNKWRFYNSSSDHNEVSNKNVYIVKTSDNHIYKIQIRSVDKNAAGITKIEFMVINL